MGRLGDPLNTFWQLFFRPYGRSDWNLVTPPGVADNGGFAASPGPDGSIAVVFDPNNLLTFSPFAVSSDEGTKWSAGLIPFGIAPVPDVLTAPSSPDSQLAAIEDGGSTVAMGTASETSWPTIYTRTELAASGPGRSCGVGKLTALAASGNGELVGSDCTTPGVVGIFQDASGVPGGRTLQLVGPKLAPSDGEFSVLRLSEQGGRVVALIDSRRGSVNVLYGLSGVGQPYAWSYSEALPLPSRAVIVSSGFGPNGTLVVETKSPTGALEAAVTRTNVETAWQYLPSLPAGTESVSVSADGKVDALSASLSELTDWELVDGAWAKNQVLIVPIQYGSSS